MTKEELYYKPCSTCHNDDCVFVGTEDTHEVCEDYQTIKALEQEPTTKIEESNFSQEQYLADIQSAYDCGKSVIDKIRAEIVELTKCPYGTECLGANCPSNTDCMICGDHVIEIIDKYKAETEIEDGNVD